MFLRALLAVLAVASTPQSREAPILVSAAISLTDALQEIAAAYRAAGGGEVRFNFAGSNVLARQLANGAPADLFISADEAQMDYAEQQGAIDRAVRMRLLRNRLAVVTPAGHGSGVRDIRDLLQLRRIAIADPAAVPAGVYARQYLEAMNIWREIQPRLLTLVNVRAALAAAESGGVDAAIVYESDAAAARHADLAFVVSGPKAPEITYPVAIVMQSKNKEGAAKFLTFLRGRAAAGIFERYRFCRVYLPSDDGPPATGPCAQSGRRSILALPPWTFSALPR